jgi:hypothetical protein
MKGTLARVYAVYPLAFPAVFAGLAALYPGTFAHDPATGVYTVNFTLQQLAAAFGGGYAIIGTVFGVWGVKR